MDSIEAVRTAHEICGALRGAADTAHLGDALGLDPHLIHRFEDSLRDCIVAAARAESGLAALVVENRSSDAFCLWSRSGRRRSGHYFPSMVMISSVTERASSGKP